MAVFGGVSSHRPTSIPTVCYVLFSAALIAPAAMLLLLLAEAFETAVDAVPLAEEIEDDASDGLEAACWTLECPNLTLLRYRGKTDN